MISTPSYPANRASSAARTNSSMVSSTCSSVRAFGTNPLIGAWIALGATRSGWCAYRPKCRICIAIRPPAACTAEVISRCCSASASSVILAPPGEGAGPLAGGDAAGDHQADAAPGALGVEGRHPLETALGLFQADVHRSHQHPVGKGGEPEVQRAQQGRVGAHRDLLRRGRRVSCRPPRTVYATSCIMICVARGAVRRPARAPFGVVGRARRTPADESGIRTGNPSSTPSPTPRPGSPHGLLQPA